MNRLTGILGILVLALFPVGTSLAAKSASTKVSYSQQKYHRMDGAQEWHNCDFAMKASIPGDFSKFSAASQIYVSVEKVGSGNEVVTMQGTASQLGSFGQSPKGNLLTLTGGVFNYSGQIVGSSKGLSLQFSSKTSMASSDYSGGNYILPIDESIASASDAVLPPFSGSAMVRIEIKEGNVVVGQTVSVQIAYKGKNRYVPGKVLPSQTIKGKSR